MSKKMNTQNVKNVPNSIQSVVALPTLPTDWPGLDHGFTNGLVGSTPMIPTGIMINPKALILVTPKEQTSTLKRRLL